MKMKKAVLLTKAPLNKKGYDFMKQAEIDAKIEELHYSIADCFKNIQVLSRELKFPEDQGHTEKIVVKLSDSLDEIRRNYEEIETLGFETPED